MSMNANETFAGRHETLSIRISAVPVHSMLVRPECASTSYSNVYGTTGLVAPRGESVRRRFLIISLSSLADQSIEV